MEAHTRVRAVSHGPWGGRYVGECVRFPSFGLRSSLYGSGLLDAVRPSEDIIIRNYIVSELASWSPPGPHVALWAAQRDFREQLVEYLLCEIHNRMVEIPSPHSKPCR